MKYTLPDYFRAISQWRAKGFAQALLVKMFSEKNCHETCRSRPMPAKDADERAMMAILPENAGLWRQALQKT